MSTKRVTFRGDRIEKCLGARRAEGQTRSGSALYTEPHASPTRAVADWRLSADRVGAHDRGGLGVGRGCFTGNGERSGGAPAGRQAGRFWLGCPGAPGLAGARAGGLAATPDGALVGGAGRAVGSGSDTRRVELGAVSGRGAARGIGGELRVSVPLDVVASAGGVRPRRRSCLGGRRGHRASATVWPVFRLGGWWVAALAAVAAGAAGGGVRGGYGDLWGGGGVRICGGGDAAWLGAAKDAAPARAVRAVRVPHRSGGCVP